MRTCCKGAVNPQLVHSCGGDLDRPYAPDGHRAPRNSAALPSGHGASNAGSSRPYSSPLYAADVQCTLDSPKQNIVAEGSIFTYLSASNTQSFVTSRLLQ